MYFKQSPRNLFLKNRYAIETRFECIFSYFEKQVIERLNVKPVYRANLFHWLECDECVELVIRAHTLYASNVAPITNKWRTETDWKIHAKIDTVNIA